MLVKTIALNSPLATTPLEICSISAPAILVGLVMVRNALTQMAVPSPRVMSLLSVLISQPQVQASHAVHVHLVIQELEKLPAMISMTAKSKSDAFHQTLVCN